MRNVAVITDSNSGISPAEAAALGIDIIPMPFFIDGELYLEGVDLTHDAFYSHLNNGADVSTSQPSMADILDHWNAALKTYSEVVYLPMTSALSSSYQTACMLAEDFGGKVEVVDNKRISCTLKQSVLEAAELAHRGYSARAIREILEREALNASIYISVDTLKYLKKGGRVTPAAASIGAVLNIKPVLQIQGGQLDAFAKVRGMKAARQTMLDAAETDMQTRFAGTPCTIRAAHTCAEEEAALWKAEIEERFPGHTVLLDPLTLSIACHIGPGALGITITPRLAETGTIETCSSN
ncbi:MAG: DegV family protein [Clostridia bacterium]|nr:DegV family protein [Clostridia bacterium]